MADVTGGTPPTNASPFAVPEDIKKVYDHFGDPGMYMAADAASLPVSGNWVGRLAYAVAQARVYVCTATPGSWAELTALGDTGWFQAAGAQLTFGSGWSHHNASGWAGVQFRVRLGRLDIQGAAAKGSWSSGETICTLTAAYRPAKQMQGTNVVISTAGVVSAGISGATAMSFAASFPLGA